MNKDSCQPIFVVSLVEYVFGFLTQILLGKLEHVEFNWKLQIIVKFESQHTVVVELESLQSQDKAIRQLPYVTAFCCSYLFAQFLRIIHVVSI